MLSLQRIKEIADKFASAPQIRGNCPTILDMAELLTMAEAFAMAVEQRRKSTASDVSAAALIGALNRLGRILDTPDECLPEMQRALGSQPVEVDRIMESLE